MNELEIIAALKASREQKLKEIDESERQLIAAIKATHDSMRSGVNASAGESKDKADVAPKQEAVEVDAADAAFPPVKAESIVETDVNAATDQAQ